MSNTFVAYTFLVVVPLPNCPTSFSPHAYTSPVFESATTWSEPADIFTMFDRYSLLFIFTLTGFVLFVVVPSPSCPLLFKPVAQTLPSAFNTTVKSVPCDMSGTAIAFSLFCITYIIPCP